MYERVCVYLRVSRLNLYACIGRVTVRGYYTECVGRRTLCGISFGNNLGKLRGRWLAGSSEVVVKGEKLFDVFSLMYNN